MQLDPKVKLAECAFYKMTKATQTLFWKDTEESIFSEKHWRIIDPCIKAFFLSHAYL